MKHDNAKNDFEIVYDFKLTGTKHDEEQQNLPKEIFQQKKKQIVEQYALFRSGQSEFENTDGVIKKIYLDIDCDVSLETHRHPINLKNRIT